MSIFGVHSLTQFERLVLHLNSTLPEPYAITQIVAMTSISSCFGPSLRLAATSNLRSRTARNLAKSPESILRSLSTLSTRSRKTHRPIVNALASSSKVGSIRPISFTPYPKSSATLSQVPPSAFSSDESKTHSDTRSDTLPILTTPAVARWLYISSGLVFFIVVVGGVTRLTESGLSITEWEPVKGILPPIGDEQWAVEWEKYRVTPEGVL